jgi:ribosomal protein L11 methyltransferase
VTGRRRPHRAEERRDSAASALQNRPVPFLQVHLTLGDLDPGRAEQACFDAGAVAVTLSDAGDNPILEPAPGATPLWPSVALSALYASRTDPAALAATLRAALDRPALEFRSEVLDDRPWEREWLKDFKPMRFGRRLWICPGGQPPPAGATSGTNPVVVWLDPGLAFGTGTHATTALCLEWLDGAELDGCRVLDVGCGSGVLAIAAPRRSAASAVALDIDRQALIATAQNAERNGVSGRLAVRPAAAPWGDSHDVVLANILAEPLVELAARFAAVARPGGRLVLSGLLSAQGPVVASACAPWFDMEPVREREGWAGLVGRRR